jgi:hypothetical protein
MSPSSLRSKTKPSKEASRAQYSTLKMEDICSSDKSVDFHWTTRHYIPKAELLIYVTFSVKTILRVIISVSVF